MQLARSLLTVNILGFPVPIHIKIKLVLFDEHGYVFTVALGLGATSVGRDSFEIGFRGVGIHPG